jgi:hypothetical protein
MSEKFQKGQLVAVRDDANGRWSIWIYDHASPEGLHLCRPPNMCGPHWWRECPPAEEVWPGVFLGWERRAGEQAAGAVAMESALVQRLRKQIAWLCQELNQINSGSDEMCHCPDSELRFAPKPMDCHPEGCASCWRDACRKAVKEKPCP